MILHDSVRNGEAKPGPARLGRIEGFEQMGDLLLRDPDTVILHGDLDPRLPVSLPLRHSNLTESAIRHGMKRIDDDVHQHLADLGLVAHHRR